MNNENLTVEAVFNLNNPYGYQLNINHPIIKEYYYRYKEYKGIPRSIPLTDSERFEFEEIIIKNFKKIIPPLN